MKKYFLLTQAWDDGLPYSDCVGVDNLGVFYGTENEVKELIASHKVGVHLEEPPVSQSEWLDYQSRVGDEVDTTDTEELSFARTYFGKPDMTQEDLERLYDDMECHIYYYGIKYEARPKLSL